MLDEQSFSAMTGANIGEQLIALLRREYQFLSKGALNDALSIANEKTRLSEALISLDETDKDHEVDRMTIIVETIRDEARRNQELWRSVIEGVHQARRRLAALSSQQSEIRIYTDNLAAKKVGPTNNRAGRYA